MDLTETFCIIDDFCKEFETLWNRHLLSARKQPPKRKSRLSTSEVITILILFHQSGYRNFKHFYLRYVCSSLYKDFPGLCSYTQFLGLQKRVVLLFFCLLQGLLGCCTGISLVDSTSLEVCHIKRSSSHRVFKGIAKKGKTTKGWFYGLKLHLIINECGEILSWMLTAGNVSDKSVVIVLAKDLFGKLFGDRGYISQDLFEKLYQIGIQLVTKIRKNMKNKLMTIYDKLLLKGRGVVDSVIGQLKEGCQIEHTRHRSPINFVLNLMGGLAAYSLRSRKPSLDVSKKDVKCLSAKS
jgi:hypothetical protein